jgi:hypothetical protein
MSSVSPYKRNKLIDFLSKLVDFGEETPLLITNFKRRLGIFFRQGVFWGIGGRCVDMGYPNPLYFVPTFALVLSAVPPQRRLGSGGKSHLLFIIFAWHLF